VTRGTEHCPACEKPARPLRLVVEGRYRLFTCTSCGTQFFRLMPVGGAAPSAAEEDSEYWESYKFDIYASVDVQRDYERRYEHVMATAEALVGEFDCLLDVGCGLGNFVEFAGRRGIRAVGSDVDVDVVARATQRGLTVFPSADLEGHVPDGSLAAVTMWDVIEHLFEPAPVVRQLAAKLRPSGALIMETPDAAFPVRSVLLSLYALSGGRVNLTDPMYYWEHKSYFTAAGLTRLLASNGLEVVKVERMTSPGAKMQHLFTRQAKADGSRIYRLLAQAWPVLERAARRAGIGNKLIVIAVKHAA
jgi:2-polyprenyl-3-methyl-5-hydroxy-6-metoxy-1,4-benzoquinol methylase